MHKIGIDLGGTTIKAARFDERGEIVKEFSIPTPARAGRMPIFKAMFCAADRLLEGGVGLIGIASAGNIDPKLGVCVDATDNLLGWKGAEIRKEFEARYHVPVLVENDAIAALKAELTFYPAARNVTMLTIGTGLGGASLVNGEIVRGKNFNGARWGHTILVPHGLRCNCGKRGCAEMYISSTALVRQGRKGLLALNDCKQLFDRAMAEEQEAIDVIQHFEGYLKILIGNIRETLGPEYIILGGGVSNASDCMMRVIGESRDIVLARRGDKAGIYGSILA